MNDNVGFKADSASIEELIDHDSVTSWMRMKLFAIHWK